MKNRKKDKLRKVKELDYEERREPYKKKQLRELKLIYLKKGWCLFSYIFNC